MAASREELPTHPSPVPARGAWLATLGVMAVFAASRLAILGQASEREYDEGVYLLSARAMLAGHPLFTSVFSSQPPAFLEALAAAMRLGGDRLETARVLMLAFSLLSLAAVADLARRLVGPWAAPAAAAALALTIRFGDLAHAVQAETPALAVALASFCAALQARERGWHSGWLLASGALLALAALFKLLVAPMALPLGLLLLSGPSAAPSGDWQVDGRGSGLLGRMLLRGAVVAAGAVAVLAVPLLLYDWTAFYEQTVGFHVAKREAFGPDPRANLLRAVRQAGADPLLVLCAAGGALLLGRSRPRRACWLGAWLVTIVGALAGQTPLFWRHFILFAPPLVLAAAALPVLVAERWRKPGRAAALALTAMAVWSVPPLFFPRQGAAMFPLLPEGPRHAVAAESLRNAARWLRHHTEPDDLVAGDDPMAVYLAERQCPPRICDTSLARILSKSLTLDEAVQHSSRARVIVLRRDGRLSSYLGGYTTWLRKNYRQLETTETGLGPARSLWVRKTPATLPEPR